MQPGYIASLVPVDLAIMRKHVAIGSQHTSDQVEVGRKQARAPVMMIFTTYAVDTHFLMSRDRHVCRTGFGRVGGRTHGSIRHALPLLARQEALRWRWQVAHRSAPFLSMFVVLSICPRMLMVKLASGDDRLCCRRPSSRCCQCPECDARIVRAHIGQPRQSMYKNTSIKQKFGSSNIWTPRAL